MDSPAHHPRMRDESPKKEGAASLEPPGLGSNSPSAVELQCDLSKPLASVGLILLIRRMGTVTPMSQAGFEESTRCVHTQKARSPDLREG